MSMTDRDWDRLDKRFDRTDSEIEAFGTELRQHIKDDQIVSAALKSHVEACNESKIRKRRTWKFWLGIISAIAVPLITMYLQNWLLTQKVLEAVKPK